MTDLEKTTDLTVIDVNINEETDLVVPVPEKRKSIMDIIKEKQNDQDFNQKMNVASTLLLELYRVLMGAFLIVFVPQKCSGEICTLDQNINRTDPFSQFTLGCNAFTMMAFLALYFIEVKRENKLISYLEVNKFNAVDNESVGEAIERLPEPKKLKIWDYDRYYQHAGYFCSAAFILNAIFSSIVVYSHYLDSKTLTVYLTNLLFMGLKVTDVYSTVNTKKNIFYSAYLKNKVQFNDVDPDKIQDIESPKVEELDDSNPVEETKLSLDNPDELA